MILQIEAQGQMFFKVLSQFNFCKMPKSLLLEGLLLI